MRKVYSVFAVVLFISSSLNANIIKENSIEEVSCLRGAHAGARAFVTIFNLDYEQEYILFDTLLENCVLNGGW